MKITTVGIDLAKSVFQVHGVSERGKAVLRKQLKRSEMLKFFTDLPPCLIVGGPAIRAFALPFNWTRDGARIIQPPGFRSQALD